MSFVQTSPNIEKIVSLFASKDAFEKIIPLKGGLSQASLYKLENKKQSYVLRLLPQNIPENIKDHQIQLATLAGQIAIGPKVHFVDPEKNALIMDFILGNTVHPKDFKSLNNLKSIAQTLKTLHSSGIDFPLAVSPFKRFSDFVSRSKETGKWEKIICVMDQINKALQKSPIELAPCHLDLNALNIMLQEDKFHFVDWVNGGISDPYFDLATFCVFHLLDRASCKNFLGLYLGKKPTELQWSRFILTKPVRLFTIAAACLMNNPFDEDKLLNINDCINKHAQGGSITQKEIGLSFFKAGVDIIEGCEFQAYLNWMK